MDPNETLRKVDTYLQNDYAVKGALPPCPEIDDWCRDLWEWLNKGGFEPKWENYPLGTSYYKCQKITLEKARV